MFFSPLEQFDVIWNCHGIFDVPAVSVVVPFFILFIVIYFIMTTILSQD